MEKSKLYSLFRSISKDEINEFARFVHSPFINESRNTAKLFEILRLYYPEFNSKSIDPAKIYFKIFPKNREVHLNSLNNLFTRLIKLLEKYISIKGFLNNKTLYEFSYLEQLKQRGINTVFRNRYKAYFELKNTYSENSSDSYLYKYLIGNLEADHLLREVYRGKNTNPCSNICINLNDALRFFYINLFRNYSRLLMLSSLYNINESVNTEIKKISRLIEQMPRDPEIPVINLYDQFIRIYDRGREPDYFALKSALFENEEYIESEDFSFMLMMLFKFGEQLFENGGSHYGEQVFELLKLVYRRKLWHNSTGKLSEHSFSITISFALKISEFDWAHKFIFDNADSIDSDNNKDIVDFNLACFHFHRAQAQAGDVTNEYELALDHISKVNSHFYLTRLSIFDILIITYYELNEIDMMFYQSDSYNHYLKVCRNLIPSPILDRQHNFNRFAHSLGKLKSDFKEWEFEKLSKIIGQEQNCARKDWLLSKIAHFRIKQKNLKKARILQDPGLFDAQ